MLGSVWGLVGVAGDVDFIIAKIEDPGWLKVILGSIIELPRWVNFGLIVIGLAFIYWDTRRNRTVPPAKPVGIPITLVATARESTRPIQRRVSSTANPDNRIAFDYSTHDGTVKVGSDHFAFTVNFSKASNAEIYVYRGGTVTAVARAKEIQSGDVIKFDNFDSSSRVYKVRLGEIALLRNTHGNYMQMKIVSIMDDSRGAPHDEVVFDYSINASGQSEFVAL